MDYNQRYEILQEAQRRLWISKELAPCRANEALATWVSTFRQDGLKCTTDSSERFLLGGFNIGQKLTFTNGETWLVRFAQRGVVHETLAYEKIATEVEMLKMIKEKTSIPVPQRPCLGWPDFQLQLYQLDFDTIGSLPTPHTSIKAPKRPLTLKTHELLQQGVNTLGNRDEGFESTIEYFKHGLN
ncbi:hypothetical protein B0T24DRAFT_685609 [Lasiosphaeria ovina]|uniref:Uncharacterized protein n=1 Tax=Lasiosphaeria ovina TaxID=92902 RepID=A0AAE0JS44_9PEZI|nr:hypothetical protein B0T24DRAFT_685609 [Lasiosphaeria ovina]